MNVFILILALMAFYPLGACVYINMMHKGNAKYFEYSFLNVFIVAFFWIPLCIHAIFYRRHRRKEEMIRDIIE